MRRALFAGMVRSSLRRRSALKVRLSKRNWPKPELDWGPGRLLSAARVVMAGDLMETAAFREGRVRLQDEGSQLVAEIAGHGKVILDCCAAPGGKTLILAERNPEARIVATD